MGEARSRDLVKTGLSLDHSCWAQDLWFSLTPAHLMTLKHGRIAAGGSLTLGTVCDLDCSEEGIRKPGDCTGITC